MKKILCLLSGACTSRWILWNFNWEEVKRIYITSVFIWVLENMSYNKKSKYSVRKKKIGELIQSNQDQKCISRENILDSKYPCKLTRKVMMIGTSWSLYTKFYFFFRDWSAIEVTCPGIWEVIIHWSTLPWGITVHSGIS